MDTLINAVKGAIGSVVGALWAAVVHITAALLWFTDLCMKWLGSVVERIPYLGPIMAVLLVVGVVIVIHKIDHLGEESEEEEKAAEKQLFGVAEQIEMLPVPGAKAIASFVAIYKIIMSVMFYPCAFIVGLFWVISGSTHAAFFSGIISTDMPYTFFNYPLWNGAAQCLCAVVVVKLAMKVVGSLCRLKLKGLLQTLILTINAVTLGMLVGMVYIWMQEASEGNFLLTVLFLLPSFAVYLIYPYMMLGLIMPFFLITLPVLGLILPPIAMILGAAGIGVAEGNLQQMKTDAFVSGDVLTYEALDRAEQGKFGLLLFVDILNM